MINKVPDTRAARNCNPFNLPISRNGYLGKIPLDQNSDKEYEQFIDKEHGLRAGIMQFIYRLRRRHLDTPRKLIDDFCPWVTAKPEMYHWYLELRGIKLDQKISYPSEDFCRLMAAIVFIESGLQYSYKYMFTIIRRFKLY